LFYDEFDRKVLEFAQKNYADLSSEGDFATSSVGVPHFEFDAFGNVCLVRRSEDSEAASPEALELFRRSQLLFRRLSAELSGRGSSLRDHGLLASLFNGHPNLASIDRKERRFVYRAKKTSISAELVTQALGGVAPLPILQAVIGGIGEEIELAIQNQKTDQRLAHLMIVVNESLPFPTANFTLFGVTASEVKQAGDFDCFKASSTDITFNYDQETWMLLEPELLNPGSSDEQISKLADSFLTDSEDVSLAGGLLESDRTPIHSEPAEFVVRALAEVAAKEDFGSEPAPPENELVKGEFGTVSSLDDVRWPSDDKNAPDYAYLHEIHCDEVFDLSGEAIESLIMASRYAPDLSEDTIALAIRGAQLTQGDAQEEQSSIKLKVVRPDHRSFNCVLGFYFPKTRLISLFSGSTVPCRLAIKSYASGGDRSNLLPTGMYQYYIWRHKDLTPALRLASGNQTTGELESGGQVTVLRSTNDFILGTKDFFDLSRPLDNVHCSYYLAEDQRLGASFSSWGCLTVRGTKEPSHEWARFQKVLENLGVGKSLNLILATGKELALAASGKASHLTSLRQGSSGTEVSNLQEILGVGRSGYFGAITADRFTREERQLNVSNGDGAVATGILTPKVAQMLGWDVFRFS
jgi:hypothetical protein